MRKLLILAVAGLCAYAPKANAITAYDLDGKLCGQMFYDHLTHVGLGRMVSLGEWEATASDQVTLHYFNGAYDLNFTLKNDKLTLNLGSSSARTKFKWTEGGSNYATITLGAAYDVTQGRNLLGQYYAPQTSNAYNTWTSEAYTTIISDVKGFRFKPSTNGGYPEFFQSFENQSIVLGDVYLFVIDPNAIGIEDNIGEYKLRYDYDTSANTIAFQNFFHLGWMFLNNYNSQSTANGPKVTVQLDANNDFTVASKEVAGFRNYMTGTYNGYRLFYSSTSGTTIYRDYIGATKNGGDIKGHYYPEGLHHHTFANNWAYDGETDGASLYTIDGDAIELGSICLYDYASKSIYDGFQANKTLIFKPETEATHYVKLNRNEFGYGNIALGNPDTYLFVDCSLTDFENSDYVESYDLYIVPGNYTSVSGSDFNHADGHAKGTRIDLEKYATDFVPGDDDRVGLKTLSATDGDAVNFKVLVPENDLKATDRDGVYSVYVRANYKAESGLTPTFHALTALGSRTTGVDDIITGAVDDENAPAVYYNLNGIEMNGDALTPGVYIRRQGTTTTKVIIK